MPVDEDKRPNKLYEFGPFRVDPGRELLLCAGEPVSLTPKTFQILLVLVRHHKEVVSKNDLMKAVWPDTFVEEANLSRNIFLLRKALGEAPEDHRYILTVPGRGYRLAEDVHLVPEREVNVVAAARAKVQVQIKETKPWAWISVAVVLLAVIAGIALDRGGIRTKLLSLPSDQLQIRSIAVLPLINLSGDPEQEYFADGMTEELITELSRIGSLRVISRTSVMHYKGEKKMLPEIARELNVDGAVEGSVLRSGNRVRITVQLLHARADQNLWAQTYERDLGDVLKLQSEVAQAIARQVRVELTPQERARLSSDRAVNPEAYEAYLKGRLTFRQLAWTPQGIKTAQRFFEEAVQKDSGFAPAYVGLADCYRDLGDFRRLSPQDAYPKATAMIRKALEIDETLAEAHRTLGWLKWRYDWDWQAAEREFNYALELSPNGIVGYTRLYIYLGWSGRRSEALAAVAKLRELDPFYAAPRAELPIYYHQRDYKAMIELGRKSVDSNPLWWGSHYFLAVGYEGSNLLEQAVPEYQRSVDLSQGDSDTVAGLAHAYAAMGKKVEAEKTLRQLQTRSKTDYVSPYMIAAIYAGLRNKDKALEFLEKAYKEKSPDLAYFLKADLRIDPLRSDPRFQDLMRRMNFPQ